MISDVFFEKSIDHNNEYKYSSNYLYYIISIFLLKQKISNFDTIKNYLENFYGEHCINNGKLKKYLYSNFKEKNNCYWIDNDNLKFIEKAQKINEELFILNWEIDSEIFKSFNNYVSQTTVDVEDGLLLAFRLFNSDNKFPLDYLISLFLDIMKNYDSYYREIDGSVNNINENYDGLPLNLIINNQPLLKVLYSNGITDINSLKTLSVESLMILFSLDYSSAIKSFTSLNDDFIATFRDKVLDIFNSLNERELQILSLRNGFNGDNPLTLEETGSLYNLTRERCRQIEAKATLKITSKKDNIKNVLINLFLHLCTKEKRYISKERLFEFVKNDLVSRYILFLYETCDLDIKYNDELKVIYNNSTTSLDDICAEILNVYGDIIYKSDYAILSDFEKSVVNYYYKSYKDSIFIKKGMSVKNLIGIAIDELFPEGYRISNINQYNSLKEYFETHYDIDDGFPSDRSIVGFLERLGYCQIDRGTYKNRDYCARLPHELIDEIINFILVNQPSVYYTTIYEKYKKELDSLGVNNYFYLKGLIDPYLPDGFKTARNQITVGDEKMSSTEILTNYINTFNGEFSLLDLREKFPGVKDYTFYNTLYNEINNGLIWLSSKRFIYISKVIITDSTIKELKKTIDETFTILGTRVTSGRKIYARLTLTNKSLLEKLKIVEDSFSMFSIIKYLFKDEYGFNRPLISLDKDVNINTYVVITNFVSKLDSFNSRTVKNFCSKMNIGGLYSYLSFMEDMSDDFVQVNIDTVINKNKFEINDEQLSEIDNMLELIFNRFSSINTKQFNGFAMLPKLKYHWNKYLLVGIIRTYFNKKYQIENTDNFYDKTDFIIRRA